MLNACLWVNRAHHRVVVISIPKCRPEGLHEKMRVSEAKRIMKAAGWGEPKTVNGAIEDTLYFVRENEESASV